MKQLKIYTLVILSLIISSCNSNKKSESQENVVIQKATMAAPKGIDFKEISFNNNKVKGLFPANWEKEDGLNSYYNNELDITIGYQMQNQGFAEMSKQYIDQYIQINKTSAPKFQVLKNKELELNGVKVIQLEAKFDNGKVYETLDYIFFTENTTLLLSGRAISKNKEKLKEIITYLAHQIN